MKSIVLNKNHSNRCPRCTMMVRYCNCDDINGKSYSDEEVDFINMQTDGRKKVPFFDEWRNQKRCLEMTKND